MKDTEKALNCPACGKEMKKVWLDEKGFFVDICTDGCGGVWLDNRELEKIDESDENADRILQELGGKIFAQTDKTKERICPLCGVKLVKYIYSDEVEPVEIDVCYTCGGKFLDNNELKTIRSQYEEKEDKVDDALSTSRFKAKGLTGMVKIFQKMTNKSLSYLKY